MSALEDRIGEAGPGLHFDESCDPSCSEFHNDQTADGRPVILVVAARLCVSLVLQSVLGQRRAYIRTLHLPLLTAQAVP